MEHMLRWGFFLISAFVIFLIIYDVWFRRSNRLSVNESSLVADEIPIMDSWTNNDADSVLEPILIESKPPVPAESADDIIVISVLAKPPTQFSSYDLLQSIAATGMQFGAMDIFHYYEPTDQGYITLFSLASATKPGKFDLDHMGDFSCVGLSLFMNKKAVPHPKKTFLLMLEKAQQLADDLNGELRAGAERLPWNDEMVASYCNELES